MKPGDERLARELYYAYQAGAMGPFGPPRLEHRRWRPHRRPTLRRHDHLV